MSLVLWESMPVGFLKMTYSRWCKLDTGVRQVIVDLAESQKFKCAICSKTQSLVVEHDHDPQEGTGDSYTVFNIRGLVCQRCNWHLMIYERDKNGDYRGWEHVESYIFDSEFESYDYVYRCRVSALIEAALEKRMGNANYWRRRNTLERFDAWHDDGERSEWRERWAERRAWEIKTPQQFFERFNAVVKFCCEQMEKDPDFVPPDALIKLIGRVRELYQKALPSF